MADLNASQWFSHLAERRAEQRAHQHFARALAQSIQLNLTTTPLFLAGVLGQPLQMSNAEALEHWAGQQLQDAGLESDHSALERLSHQLKNLLEDAVA